MNTRMMVGKKYNHMRFLVETNEKEELMHVLERYRNELCRLVRDGLFSGRNKLYSSSEIDPMIYSRCRVCIAMDAVQICRAATKRKNKFYDEKEPFIESILPKNPLCTWNTHGYKLMLEEKSLHLKILDNESSTIKNKTKYIKLSLSVTDEQISVLRDSECRNITIECVDGLLYADIRYTDHMKEKPLAVNANIIEQGTKPNADDLSEYIHLQLSDAMKDDLNLRGSLNLFPKGFSSVIRYMALHPVVVVKRRMTKKTEVSDSDTADCLEILLSEIDIPYIRDGCFFNTNLSESHIKSLCKYFIGSKSSFLRIREETSQPLKRRCVSFSKEDAAYIKSILRGGYPYYLSKIAFYPFVVSETAEVNEIEVHEPKVADRIEKILMENKIEHEWDGVKFVANIEQEGLHLVYGIAGRVRSEAVPAREFTRWVSDNYGVSIHNQLYSALKMKYNFAYKSQPGDEKKKFMSCSKEKEIACIGAFVHFGMMSGEEAKGYIEKL